MLVAIFAFTPVEALASDVAGRWGWAGTVLAAAGYGAGFGLLPIGWIVLNAVFLYALTVETGAFETVKNSVLALSDDRRIQALLIAYSFGSFLEGAAGFHGTPKLAVSAALMVGAGFRPLDARPSCRSWPIQLPSPFRSVGDADHDAGTGNWPRRVAAQRHGGQTIAFLFTPGSGLAGVGDGRLARRRGRLAGSTGESGGSFVPRCNLWSRIIMVRGWWT